jgi:hypothetical protein
MDYGTTGLRDYEIKTSRTCPPLEERGAKGWTTGLRDHKILSRARRGERMRAVLTMACVIVAVTIGGCSNDKGPAVTVSTVNSAIDKVLRPRGDVDTTRKALKAALAGASPTLLRAALGDGNLTTFLLTLTKYSPLMKTEDFMWDYKPNIQLMGKKMNADMSIATVADIQELHWQPAPKNSVLGIFSLDMDYGLKATFYFKAQAVNGELTVTRLVVARKGSSDISMGCPVVQRR